MANPDRIKYLLQKYFHNQCSGEEKEELLQWMQSPVNQQELENYLMNHWQEVKDDVTATIVNYDQAWQKLQQNIEDEPLQKPSGIWYKVAAGFLVIAFSALGLWLLTTTESSSDISFQSYENPKGTRSQVLLPDSTIVWLNAESKITYPEKFSNDVRKVVLSGEAYFEVTKGNKPFVISMENAEIEVLGTSFNVSAYPQDEKLTTTLVEGKVILKIKEGIFTQTKKTTLTSKQRASYSKENKQLNLEKVADVSLYTSWKEGKLLFENARFSVVATKLERWFDKEIELLDDIKKERFTGQFEKESLKQILEIVNASTPIEYSISGNKVLIKMKN